MIERMTRARRLRNGGQQRIVRFSRRLTSQAIPRRRAGRRSSLSPLLFAAVAAVMVLAVMYGRSLSLDDPSASMHTALAQPEDASTDLMNDTAEWSGVNSADDSTLAAWYQLAAAEYGVSEHLLRALHQVESNAAPGGCIRNMQGSGAIGPFQFKPATFGQYGVDGNRDGTRDICSFPDGLFSAARYLSALGTDDLDDAATRKALVRYGTDPGRVLSLATHYRDVAARTQ